MKYVYKRNESDYIVGLEADGSGIGYNVVLKEIDPSNRYEIENVATYLEENPEKLLPPDIYELTLDQKAQDVRQERDRRIAAVEWRIRRHEDEVALGLESTEDILLVRQYIQTLRDITEQEGFPVDVVWPKKPLLEETEP